MTWFRQAFPTRALLLLLAIGLIDLVSTAVLHAQGKIVEMNPVMRPFIDRSEWLFVAVKGMTLLLGWLLLAKFSQTHLGFVRRACLIGTSAYVGIWVVWFFHG